MTESWNGFSAERFSFEGYEAIVVFPRKSTSVGRLAVKTEYWDAFVQTEIDLLESGFHLCYLENETRFGLPEDLDRKSRFLYQLTKKHNLQSKTVLVGMSCGGLIAVQFAARHPEQVACMYLDAPVLNYLSWPCGFGSATVGVGDHQVDECLNAHHMQSISELIGYRQMPLDVIPKLIRNKIPVVMVAGGSDLTVPYHENGAYLQKAYEQAGVDIEIFIKPECAHHPHGLSDSTPIRNFIMSH